MAEAWHPGAGVQDHVDPKSVDAFGFTPESRQASQRDYWETRVLERILADERADDDTYTTVVSLVFPPGGLSVRAVSAGHPGLLLRRSGEIRWVEPQAGIALGLFPGCEDWTATDIPLSPHDGVVLFTDGLFEGRTAPSARLGEEGLLRLATQHSHLPGQEFIDALVHGAASRSARFGGLADDIAVLHLGWNAES
ncbi:PP2C family protein-serine/threonine phosphatase [Streptomyces sp. NPDC050804]|uniref:PP2C family protein-serine/threonine phosphatase n=1 Tax=Streptomyces sp. NPDC050804 TaxID=3154745 RepID=UPI0034480C5B